MASKTPIGPAPKPSTLEQLEPRYLMSAADFGLVAHYGFDTPTSSDPVDTLGATTGSIIVEGAGTYGAPEFSTGQEGTTHQEGGGAWRFEADTTGLDGNSIRLEGDALAGIADGVNSDGLTVAFWVNANSADSVDFARVLANTDSTLDIRTFRSRIDIRVGGQLVTADNVIDGQWHHIGLSVQLNGDMVLYVDGAESSRAAYTGGSLQTTNRWAVASRGPNGGNRSFAGSIDDLGIFDRALDSADVAEIASTSVLELVADPTPPTGSNPLLGEVRQLSEVPEIGIHPRVLFSEADLNDIRNRMDNTTVGGILGNQTTNWYNAYQLPTFQELAGLDLSNPTVEQVNQYWVHNEGRNIGFFLGALDGVLENDPATKQLLIDAVTNYGRLINASQQLLPTHSDWTNNAWNLGVAGRAGGTGYALAYDLLHNDMTVEQRDIVRSSIANSTAGRRSWGMEFPETRAYSNWYMYNLNLVPMVLAIEGEDGYDGEIYDLAVQAAQDYFDHSVYPDGANFEDIYGTLALREGSEAMMAMARRGDNFFLHPHYQAMVEWAGQSLNPFPTSGDDGGGFVGHAGGGGQSYPNFWTSAKYMFPDSSLVDFAWDHYNDDNYWAVNRFWQSYSFSTLFATDTYADATGTATTYADTGMSLTEFYERRGLLITRSDASTDAAYLHFDARPDAFLSGHDNADRGGFTFSALGRSWVPDDLWGTFKESTDHSLVHIDGVGQAYKAPSVRFLEHADDGTFVTAAADLEYAYDWQWSPPWPSANTTYPAPWEHETSDPRDLGWPVDDPYLPDSLYGHADFGFNGMYMWRAPHNEVQRAYRSLAFARGDNPYLVMIDDIKKDDAAHDYQWYLHLEEDLVLDSINGRDIVLASPSDNRRLLVRVLQAEGTGDTVQATLETYTKNGTEAKRLIITSNTVEPKFKVMLQAFEVGDDLPTTTWNGSNDVLQITNGDQTDTLTFNTDSDGRTLTSLVRGGTPTNNPATGLPTIAGSPVQGQTLTADTSAIADTDGLGGFTYQWQRDGSTILGETANTYTLTAADVGSQISVSVGFTDGQGNSEGPLVSGQTSAVTALNNPASGLPSVTGTTIEGQALSADTSAISDADGLGAFTYQWQRDGASVSGQTGATYVLTAADVGSQISVVVSFTDGQGNAEGPLVSAATAIVTAANSSAIGQPVVVGIPVEDETLTVDTSGIADADGVGAFSYQWLRDGVIISGATANAYTLTATDVGSQISVSVSFTDGQGNAEGPLTSDPSATVTPAPIAGPQLAAGLLNNISTNAWTTVNLSGDYNAMIVVATPVFTAGQVPLVTRITNVTSNSFDVKVQRADGSAADVSGVQVQYVVAEAGVYTQAEHGITLEAVAFNSTITAENNSWVGQARAYQGSYSSPVVLGQVMSYNDARWSTFWSQGASRTSAPTASSLTVGKHVGEDPDTSRADETIGYLVIEAGSGEIDGLKFSAGLGSDIVRGTQNGGTYNYTASGLNSVTSAVLSMAGVDGGDGGFAVINGSANSTGNTLAAFVDEDTLNDAERSHTTEQVAWFAFEQPVAPLASDDVAATNMDTAVVIDVLGNDTDPNNDPLSIAGFTQAANGTVTDNGDGTLTYTPNAGYLGPDSFTYQVADGVTGTDSATVQISVNSPSAWTALAYEDFESGFGTYTDGGNDAILYTGSTHAHQGSNAANLQDNSGVNSSITLTDPLALNSGGYTSLKVEFWFKAVSFENNEDFLLQFYDGSTWQTLRNWTVGSDFANNDFNFASVEISSLDYNFTDSAQIRLQADASGNGDDVYIDEITISAK